MGSEMCIRDSIYATCSLTFMPTHSNQLCIAGVAYTAYGEDDSHDSAERAGYLFYRALVE